MTSVVFNNRPYVQRAGLLGRDRADSGAFTVREGGDWDEPIQWSGNA